MYMRVKIETIKFNSVTGAEEIKSVFTAVTGDYIDGEIAIIAGILEREIAEKEYISNYG